MPQYLTTENNTPVMVLTGLQSRLGNGLRSCTILTRPPCPQIAHIHNPMPVILPDTEVAPIGREADGPDLIEPVERLI